MVYFNLYYTRKMGSRKVLKKILSLVILFLTEEILNYLLLGMPELKNLDLRLIFVLIISSYFGIKYGIISSILVGISYFIQKYMQGYELSILMLNTNNWIPAVIYIAFSIIIGLKTDKDNLKIKDLRNEIKNKNDKEIEQKEVIQKYEDVIRQLNQTLIIHDKSYIQVAKILRLMEKSRNNISKTNRILKIILKNSSCELLDITNNNEKISRFLDDKKINIMMKNKIWINKKLEEGLPFYMIPIYINTKEKLLLVVWKCEFEQMNTEYRNQIIGISEIVKFIFTKVGKEENVNI